MKVFGCYLKDALSKKFSFDSDAFVSRKKKHVHIAFKISISEYESFDRLVDFISNEWEKRKIFFEDYKMIYSRLISSLKWKFDCLFWEESKKWKTTPYKKMCNKTVDVIYETFTRKYCFVKISQSKKGHVYLIVRKKRGRLLGEEKNALHKKIFDISQSIFNWYDEKYEFLGRKYFFNPKLLKDCSGYYFHYFLVSCDKYVNEYYWWNLLLSLHVWCLF